MRLRFTQQYLDWSFAIPYRTCDDCDKVRLAFFDLGFLARKDLTPNENIWSRSLSAAWSCCMASATGTPPSWLSSRPNNPERR